MAKKRAVLAILAILVLLIPAAYYGYYRVIRQEHFYRGMPTSYWHRRLELFDKGMEGTNAALELLYQLGLAKYPPVLCEDQAAVPVLLQLAQSKNEAVAWLACSGLSDALPELKAATQGWTEKSIDNFIVHDSHIILVLHDSQNILFFSLTSQEGKVIDVLSCQIHSNVPVGECFKITPYCLDESHTEFVAEYDPPEDWKAAESDSHVITLQGKQYRFFWQTAGRAPTPAEQRLGAAIATLINALRSWAAESSDDARDGVRWRDRRQKGPLSTASKEEPP